jgi:hypothetical protein
MANGLANRFLWICVKRSKCLPEGGELHKVDFNPLVTRLQHAVVFARELARYGGMMRHGAFGAMSIRL